MIILKTMQDVVVMKHGGKLLANLFHDIEKIIVAGNNAKDVDNAIEAFIVSHGMKPECKGYGRKNNQFPAASCISINDVVVHGIPRCDMLFRDGDIVKVDVVASLDGLCVDMARSFVVGNGSAMVNLLKNVAFDAFLAALSVAVPGNFVSDISGAVQRCVERQGLFVVREFVGHGIGRLMHEDPQVPNFICNAPQVQLVSGMTLAIEPMVLEAKDRVLISDDGWTARSTKGYLSSHYEDTILITDVGCEVLTCTN